MENNLLEMKGITKSFGGTLALDHVDFAVRKGEIHGLIGQNGAGKSTLIRILVGAVRCDNGTIYYSGRSINIKAITPDLVNGIGIRVMHQEPVLISNLSIAENMFLGQEITRVPFRWVDKVKQNKECERILKQLNLEWNPRTKVNKLSLGKRRIIEVARALCIEQAEITGNLFVMDEPTASLTYAEKEWLFDLLHHLKTNGHSVIFISHYLDEVLRVADRITILRNGKLVETLVVDDGIEADNIISLLVGSTQKSVYKRVSTYSIDAPPIIEVRKLSKHLAFEDISFTICKGEAVGIAGTRGAGQEMLSMALFGATQVDSGEILINGKRAVLRTPRDAICLGIGMVPEDRQTDAIISRMSVSKNITLPILNKLINRLGFVNNSKERKIVSDYSKMIDIRMASPYMAAMNLSGGNAQKVVLARWLALKPSIIILNEPTRGVDVRARSEIHKLIIEIVLQGITILLISSELEELCVLCHRVLALKNGKIIREFHQNELNEKDLLSYITF
jgi:ABC-type sugar transport system ATPase subunit